MGYLAHLNHMKQNTLGTSIMRMHTRTQKGEEYGIGKAQTSNLGRH